MSASDGTGTNGDRSFGGSIADAITRIGVWACIVLFLLGAFDGVPGIKSPVTRIIESNDRLGERIEKLTTATEAAMAEHDKAQARRDARGEESRVQLIDLMSALLRHLTMMDPLPGRRRQ